MKRIQRSELIVLKSEKSGENHRLVTLFTEESVLIRALAFGAAGSKSAMRAVTTPFCLCDGELYHDPVKDLWRINHLTGLDLFDGIREDLKKFYTVSLMSEIILKSYGGGDDRVYRLFSKTLRLIDNADNDGVREKLLVLYLWRYLRMNGVMADPGECGTCGREIRRGESSFYGSDGMFHCGACSAGNTLELNHRAMNYLYDTSSMTLDDALNGEADQSSLLSLKKCFILMVQAMVEYPLKTLKSGGSFI